MDDGGSFLAQVWQGAGRLVAFSIVVLVAMSFTVLIEIVERRARYALAFWQSRSFIKRSVSLLESEDLEGVQTLAAKLKRSHVARVVSGGLREFRFMCVHVSAGRAVEAAEREMRVTANRVHEELRKGLSGLGSIATTAPLVGLFGTTIGILDSFRGIDMQKSAALAMIAGNLAASLATTALGMLVAVFAVWCFNWLTDRLATIDAESRIASLELVRYLDRFTKRNVAG
jgi:biopolymer transport protein ExbB/TolQ